MRHEALGINLESPATIDIAAAMRNVKRSDLMASLSGVDVYVAGAVAPGRLPSYWESLRAFWVEYLSETGSNLPGFLVNRDVLRYDQ